MANYLAVTLIVKIFTHCSTFTGNINLGFMSEYGKHEVLYVTKHSRRGDKTTEQHIYTTPACFHISVH